MDPPDALLRREEPLLRQSALPPPHFLPLGPAPLRCACARANTWLPRSQSSNGGRRRRSCRPPVSRGGSLRLLPAEPGLLRFGVCRRSPASVGDSKQPAAPRICAFSTPQRYLHLPGLGASSAAGQGKARGTAGRGYLPRLGLGVSQTRRRVARHRAWPSEAQCDETRNAAAVRSGPMLPASCAACSQGSERVLGPNRLVVDGSRISGLNAVFAPRPVFAGAAMFAEARVPQGQLPSAGLCSCALQEPWLLTEPDLGATLLFYPLIPQRLCLGWLGSTSLVSLLPDTPHPPLLGAGSPRVVFHVQDVGLFKFSNFSGSFPFPAS